MITARLAAESGREVMAIPGSPLEPRSHGCNHLIREGAVLVQEPADIATLLATAPVAVDDWRQTCEACPGESVSRG